MKKSGPKPKTHMDLSPQEEIFIECLLAETRFDRAQAYQRAFPHIKSRRSAQTLACKMLTRPHIKSAIKKKVARRVNSVKVTQARVLREDAAIAFLDPICVLDDTGNVLPLHLWPKDARRALASIKVTRGAMGQEILEYKFYDKDRSLLRLGRRTGTYVDSKNEFLFSGQVTAEIDIAPAVKEIVRPFARLALDRLLELKRQKEGTLLAEVIPMAKKAGGDG